MHKIEKKLSVRELFSVWRACHISRVKIPRGVVIDEPKSDLQVSYREVWERGSNSEIVA